MIATRTFRALVFFLLLKTAVVGQPRDEGGCSVSRQVFLMGTQAAITLRICDRAYGLAQMERLIRILEETEAELSSWRPDTILGALNALSPGEELILPEQTCRTFQTVFRWSRKTKAAFDPSLGTLLDSWGIRTGGRLPSEHEVQAAMKRTGVDQFSLSDGCRISRSGDVHLDAGAFGKGEALDRLKSYAIWNNLQAGLANLGGQVVVWGSDSWKIDVAHPTRREQVSFELYVKEGSVAVSGRSERNLQVGSRKVNHILDPRTGSPADFEGAVVVWHDSALVADILSTALFVMGPEEGKVWAERENVSACFLIPSGEKAVTVLTTHKFSDLLVTHQVEGTDRSSAARSFSSAH